MNTNLKELCDLIEGTITVGELNLPITGFSSIKEAESGEITFLGNARYASSLKKSKASAVIVDEQFTDIPEGIAVIRVNNPTLKFSLIIDKFGPQKQPFIPGIHPTAVMGANTTYNPKKVYIGPCAIIEDGVEIGDGTSINGGVFIGRNAKIGNDCLIHANAVIKDRCVLGNRVIIHSCTVIGSDGFGYEFAVGKHLKIDQVGIVQIDDDVEVGSCTTIDRARFGRTWIGEGTKIDNLVQIAHNVITGKHCILVSQVGISGSTRLGNYVTLAGQTGVAGHLNITDQVTMLGRSGVTKDIDEPGAYMGYPTKPLMEGRRYLAYPSKVPSIIERLKVMEEKVKQLESKLTEI